MDIFDAIRAKLLSPAVLFFVLGLIAALTESDLKFPELLYIGLTMSGVGPDPCPRPRLS